MFRSSCFALMLVLVLSSACGAQNTPPTVVPAASASIAGPTAVFTGTYTDADLTQAIVLDLMESRIKLSLPAWKAANYDLSKRLANVASQYAYVEFTLKSKQADVRVKPALDAYTAVIDKAGDEAKVMAANKTLLDALASARQAVYGAQLADPRFQAELVFRLLTWTSDTYARNSTLTGADLAYAYQRAYGYEQAAKARFAAIAKSTPDAAAISAQFAVLDASFPATTPASLDDSAKVAATTTAIKTALQKSFGLTTPSASFSNLIEYTLRATQTGVDLYKAGKAIEAYQAMTDGYLNGFEFIEAGLDTKDKDFRSALESKFTDIRNGVRSGRPVAEIDALMKDIVAGMVIAGDLLSGKVNGPVKWALAPTPAPAATGATPTAAANAPVSAALKGVRDARTSTSAALARYKEGKTDEAYELAVSAYLNGFESAEPELAKKDRAMMEALEVQFKNLRDAMKAKQPVAAIEALVQTIGDGLDKAEKLLQ